MSSVLTTALLLNLTSLLSGAAAFLFLQKRARDKRPMLILAVSYLLICFGAMLAGAGELHALPLALWTSLSLWIGHLGYALLLIGMRALDHRRNRRLAILFSLSGLAILAIAATTTLWHDEQIRTTTFHLLAALCTGAAAWNIWTRNRTEPLPSRKSLASALGLSAAAFAIVGVAIVAGDDAELALTIGFAIQTSTNYLISIFVFGLVKDRIEQHLELVSSSDPLTGIGNRRWFETHLPRRIMPGDALLVLDIDHFKQVNDGYGHPTGDRVLVEFCQRIKRVLRGSDQFARIGGEEFVIFSSRLSRDKIDAIGERLRAAVAKMVVQDREQEIRITTSIGICWCAQPSDDIASVLQVADRALYQAKAQGRDRVKTLVL